MKALIGPFNQEKALVGAFTMIVKTDGSFAALVRTVHNRYRILIPTLHQVSSLSATLPQQAAGGGLPPAGQVQDPPAGRGRGGPPRDGTCAALV